MASILNSQAAPPESKVSPECALNGYLASQHPPESPDPAPSLDADLVRSALQAPWSRDDVTLTVYSLGGTPHDVPVCLAIDLVKDLKEKIAMKSGIATFEQRLLCEGIELSDDTSLSSLTREAFLFLVRTENAASKSFAVYKQLLKNLAAAESDFSDWKSRANCGACYHKLGEKQQSWDSYRLAVQSLRNSRVALRDEELLADPTLGKYLRTLQREYSAGGWAPPSKEESVALFSLLVLQNQTCELFKDRMDQVLPNLHNAMMSELLGRIRPTIKIYDEKQALVTRKFTRIDWDPQKMHLLDGCGTGNVLYLSLGFPNFLLPVRATLHSAVSGTTVDFRVEVLMKGKFPYCTVCSSHCVCKICHGRPLMSQVFNNTRVPCDKCGKRYWK